MLFFQLLKREVLDLVHVTDISVSVIRLTKSWSDHFPTQRIRESPSRSEVNTPLHVHLQHIYENVYTSIKSMDPRMHRDHARLYLFPPLQSSFPHPFLSFILNSVMPICTYQQYFIAALIPVGLIIHLTYPPIICSKSLSS
jgi:hypothetical protein